MQCRKCKEEIPAGYTFCRRCATSIYVDDEQVTTNYVNKSKINELRKTTYSNNNYEPIVVNNKDLMDKDQNDRKKATLVNIGGLILLLIVLFLIVLIFIKFIKKL